MAKPLLTPEPDTVPNAPGSGIVYKDYITINHIDETFPAEHGYLSVPKNYCERSEQ